MATAAIIPLKEHLSTLQQDALLWKARHLYDASGSPDDKQKGIDAIAAMLSLITEEVKRDTYMEILITNLKIKRGHLINAMKGKESFIEDLQHKQETVHKLPAWADKDRVYNYALDWRKNCGAHTGFYFSNFTGQLTQMTNFVIEPLYHLKDMTGNTRRLALLHRGSSEDMLVELPSKAFISTDKFEEMLMDLGNFSAIEGFSKSHLKRIFRAIGDKFPYAYELKFLGWQLEGFWSYSNAAYHKGKLLEFNEFGMTEIANKHYYSPSASSLFKDARKDEDGKEINEDNPYMNDKSLKFMKTKVTFEQYSQHMVKMHHENAIPLICYAIVSINKDIITSYEKCPILYGYGLVQSGKSTWAECLYYWFHDISSKPFNLNQGTIYAFFNRMERFRNVPQLFNEFDEDKISDEFYGGFKSFYDGEGRDKGRGIKGKTETQNMNCTVVLIGQTLTTKDGASVLIRTIPTKFPDPGERTEEEKANYDTWMSWVAKGVNGNLIEALEYRPYFKEHFSSVFNEELTKLKTAIKDQGDNFKERIAKNYCILLASGKIMLEKMNLGFTYDELYQYCLKNIVDLSRMISEVDNLATFWKTVEFLYERGDIIDDMDFKVVEENQIRKTVGKETIVVPFEQSTKVLYMRLTKVYPLYAQNYRLISGNKPINQRTLETYFESSKSFIGTNPGIRFKAPGGKQQVSTSFMFDYSRITINLERISDEKEETRKPYQGNFFVVSEPILQELAEGKKMMIFSVAYYTQIVKEGVPKSEQVIVKCFANDISLESKLKRNVKVHLKGLLEEKENFKGGITRNFDVEIIQLLNVEGNVIAAEGEPVF